MKIAVVGSINKDIILKVERHPKPGETLSAQETDFAFGGKGANQAVAAARLGAEVVMIGAVGYDVTGDEQVANFRKENIRTEAIMRCDVPSGVAYITVDAAGENSIILYPGANYKVTPEWVRQNRAYIEDADVILLQLEIPVACSLAAAEIAASSGTKVIFNPAPVHPVPARLFELTDIITPNESELALLADTNSIPDASAELLSRGVKAVLATLGKDGARYQDSERTFNQPTYQSVTVADTTAAGDSFNAAIAVSLGSGQSLEEATMFASAVGSLAVSKPGAQPSLPTLDEVTEFMESHDLQI